MSPSSRRSTIVGDAVDMAGDDMAAELIAELQRALQVDAACRAPTRRASCAPASRSKPRRRRSRGPSGDAALHHRQARAGAGDRRADRDRLGIVARSRCGSARPPRAASTASTSPTSVTIPVNISARPFVAAHPVGAETPPLDALETARRLDGRKRQAGKRRHDLAAESRRGCGRASPRRPDRPRGMSAPRCAPPSTSSRVMPSSASRDRAAARSSPCFKPAERGSVERCSRRHPRPRRCRTPRSARSPYENAPVAVEPASAVEHHADRRAILQPRQPAGQLRIVGLDRAAADQDGVEARAERLDVPARDLARHRHLRLADASDRVVGGDRELQRAHAAAACRCGADARHAPGAPPRRAGPSRPRSRPRAAARTPAPPTRGSGSAMGATTRATPGRDDRIGAGRRAAVMRAGLERDVERCAARRLAGLGKRRSLRHAAARPAPCGRGRRPCRPSPGSRRPPDSARSCRARPRRAGSPPRGSGGRARQLILRACRHRRRRARRRTSRNPSPRGNRGRRRRSAHRPRRRGSSAPP